jgi:hypothetical protein
MGPHSLPGLGWKTTRPLSRSQTQTKALEALYDQVVSADLPEWNQNPELLTWLANL